MVRPSACCHLLQVPVSPAQGTVHPPSLQTQGSTTEAPHRIFTKEFGLIWDVFPKSVRPTLCCPPGTAPPAQQGQCKCGVYGALWELWG